ncbi:MAG: DoxX family protein [Bacteroidota bacterium]
MKVLTVYIMGLLYIAAGVWHFMRPQGYIRIVPPWLPSPLMLVYISGACEILLGVLLFPEYTRSIAAWGIIALLIAVFPANIQMTINYFHYNNPMKWLTVVRLPLQLVIIWWAWQYT